MTQTDQLDVAREFSETPGARNATDGPFSGEQFLEQLLDPRFERALKAGGQLLVNLDGTAGYATSFLEAAFGGLARHHGAAAVRRVLLLKTEEEPYLEAEIMKYIDDTADG
jgi:hypothetical protein